ncbi:MAG: flagellar basal body-associated FliL family protein [Bdellovibrionaceae bacterium]|nr:flagellar basal body-associated FliL family protein [Pseudobdellovibrionaceae bacterium]
MSEQTKAESSQSEAVSDGGIEESQLDALIAAQDPEFALEMEKVFAEGSRADVHLDVLDLDALLAEEESRTFRSRLRRLRQSLALRWAIWKNFLISSVREGIPSALNRLKSAVAALSSSISQAIRAFKYYPLHLKLRVYLILLTAFVAFGYLGILWVKRGIIPRESHILTLSLEEFAASAKTFDPKEMESFYNSRHTVPFIYSMQRMVVNLQKSPASGPSPMVAFALMIDGDSNEALVEFKSRESEMRDIIQDFVSETRVENWEGDRGARELLREKLTERINRILTEGRIRTVYFDSLIIKP